MNQNQAWNQYQENRDLIDAFKRQTEAFSFMVSNCDGPNYGITFAMYRQARTDVTAYEIARYQQEGTNCPYWIEWSKPAGLNSHYRKHHIGMTSIPHDRGYHPLDPA